MPVKIRLIVGFERSNTSGVSEMEPNWQNIFDIETRQNECLDQKLFLQKTVFIKAYVYVKCERVIINSIHEYTIDLVYNRKKNVVIDPKFKTRICPPYPNVRRKGNWNGAISRNKRKKVDPVFGA